MQALSVQEIIGKIKRREIFECVDQAGGFKLKIEQYLPHVAAAIHAGGKLRPELEEKIHHTLQERWYEEDDFTDDFITSMPIVLVGLDSRYEYDLNRAPEAAIYDEAWGKEVWKKPLTKKERADSLRKHQNFYKVAEFLVSTLLQEYNKILVYDIHSYNYKRIKEDMPLFNVGTERIIKGYEPTIEKWKTELANIRLTNVTTTVEENGPFYGRGYFLNRLHSLYPNCLVLATEVKKVFCDELTMESHPKIIRELGEQFKVAMLKTSHFFTKKYLPEHKLKKPDLLSTGFNKGLLKADKLLHKMVRSFEVLNFVNPVNFNQEFKRFIALGEQFEPKFKYRHLNIDPFQLKRDLYSIPVEEISDISLKSLYKDVINAYADKVNLLSSIGSQDFLYNNLRYFGEPSDADINIANFLINCPDIDPHHEATISAKDSVAQFQDFFAKFGIQGNVKVTSKLVSKAMVLSSKQQVLIKSGEHFSQQEVDSLLVHEIGVHYFTSLNASAQKLRIWGLGCPVNTLTQEGLAIYFEYMSGNLTLKRLKELAIRVLGVHHMIQHQNFTETYHYLKGISGWDPKRIFNVTTRIYRGGGFTKDYLYLRGFREILKFVDRGNSIENLFIGKTHHKYHPLIGELIQRGIVEQPKLFMNMEPIQQQPELELLIKKIKGKSSGNLENSGDKITRSLVIPGQV